MRADHRSRGAADARDDEIAADLRPLAVVVRLAGPRREALEEFIAAARGLPWPGRQRTPLSEELKAIIRDLAADPHKVIATRTSLLEKWEAKAVELEEVVEIGTPRHLAREAFLN